jgi:hypothetical protein
MAGRAGLFIKYILLNDDVSGSFSSNQMGKIIFNFPIFATSKN